MVSTAQLASLRTVANRELLDRCVIEQPVKTRDDSGGTSTAWQTVASNVPCRLTAAQLTPEEQVIAEQISAITAWRIALPAGTAVESKYRIIIGGRIFEVAAALGPRTDEVLRRVLAQEVP